MKTKAAKAPEDKLSVGHHRGENIWGYDVLPDGSVRLCESVADANRRLIDRERGVKILLDSVQKFCADEFTNIEKDRALWWRKILGDLGISPDDPWAFHTYEGTVKRLPKKASEP